MKTPTASTINNLLNRFDKELRKILLNDLSATRMAKADLVNAVQNKINTRFKAA